MGYRIFYDNRSKLSPTYVLVILEAYGFDNNSVKIFNIILQCYYVELLGNIITKQ